MRLYLDNCCFNRPFDDQSIAKNRLETEAVLIIQERILNREYELVWSYVLEYENSRNPYVAKRNDIRKWRALSACITEPDSVILDIAKSLKSYGIKAMDALHIACAVCSECDYFRPKNF